MKIRIILAVLILKGFSFSIHAQTSCLRVQTHQKISDTRGYFTGVIDNSDQFGSPAYLGDINGDGIGDIAVGAQNDDDGGADRGAVWIIFLDRYGRALSHKKISYTQGSFSDTLDNGDLFGTSVCSIGDINNDGVTDISVGAPFDDDGGSDRGAVWILMLDTNANVIARQKISSTKGGVSPQIRNGDNFGSDLSLLGDINNDGNPDIGVASPGDDDGGSNRGAIWIIFLDTLGKSVGCQKISDTIGNFNGGLHDGDNFGALSGGFDLDNDGFNDVAVGSPGDDDGGSNRGAVWVLFLDSTGLVKAHQKISDTTGNFTGVLLNGDAFGSSVGADDVDGDGIVDLFIGTDGCDDGGADRGGLWLLYISTSGLTNLSYQITDTKGNFVGLLDNVDRFGGRIDCMGDFNSDGFYDIAVAALADDDGGTDRGAVWLLSLGPCGSGCASSPTEERFTKSYPANGNDKAHSIISSSDNTYVICGTTSSYGAGGLDWFVMKISERGDTIWTRTFGTTSDETGNSIIMKQVHDGGYLLIGRTFGFSTTSGGILMLKLDINGATVWQKVVDGSSNEHGRALEITSDKGFIISGTNGYVLKFDSSGTLQWNRYYSGGGNMHFVSVREVPDKKEYFVVGETTSYGSGGRSAYVLSLDSTGTKKWERIYDNTFEDRFMTILRTPDRGYILTGSTQFSSTVASRRGMVAKIDSVGKLIWSRHYSSGNSHDWFLKIVKAKGSGYLITGYTELTTTNKNTLMKIDDFGNVEWGRSHVGNSSDIETYWGENLVNIKGGYMFANYKPGVNSSFDIFISKMNSCGEAACSDFAVTYTYEERELNMSDPVSSVTTWGSTSSVTTTKKFLNSTDNMNCEIKSVCRMGAAFSSDTACLGDTTHFTDLSYDSASTLSGWRWYFGDGDSAINVKHPSHLYPDTGSYNVMLVIFNTDTFDCSDTIIREVRVEEKPLVDLGSDTLACQGDTVFLNAAFPGCTYLWSNLSTTPDLAVHLADTYRVEVNYHGCKNYDTIVVDFEAPPVINLGNDTLFCEGDSIMLNATTPGGSYLWQDNSTNAFIFVDTNGLYSVIVKAGVCEVSDSIFAGIDVLIPPDFGPDTSICDAHSLVLNAASPGATYLWSNASTGSSLSVSDTGEYWVRVTSSTGSCVAYDTIYVLESPSPVIDLGPDTSFCEMDSLVLAVFYPGATYLWSTSSTDSFIVVKTPGTYSVTATLGLCIETEVLIAGLDSLPIVDLGIDGGICEGDSLVLRLSDEYDSYLWSNGDTSFRAVFTEEGQIWVVVAKGQCGNSDSVYLSVKPRPLAVLPDSVFLCLVPSVNLDAGNPGSYYDWSTGEKTQIIKVSEEGIYTVEIINNDFCDLLDSTFVDRCVVQVFIPNTITPNGDGSNDVWFIKNIDQFPGNTVEIFNRDGFLLFSISNYGNDWKGTYKGVELPEAVYFYVVNLANGEMPYKGTITIVRE